jgi:hypothetical protein
MDVEMIPTLVLFGAIFGRWWRIALVVAALSWPLFLIVTDVVGFSSKLVEAAALAVVNAGVGVLVHQGGILGYRHVRRPTFDGTSI